jgi:large subunit ribosomal protein L30
MKVRIRLKKSVIGRRPDHRRTVRALGLCKIGDSIIKELSPAVEGMIKKVFYLLEVEEID